MKSMTSQSAGLSWKFYILVGLSCFLVFFAADVFATEVGIARWNKDTLDPQAKASFSVIEIIALIAGGVFMLIGFMSLGGQHKSRGVVMIIVGGLLTSIGFFMTLTGETVSGKELNETTQSIINRK